MKFDVAFIDASCSKPYTFNTIEYEGIGGTECSTFRLAEGFQTKGHKVAILQRGELLPNTTDAGVKIFPMRWLNQIKADVVIHLRSRQYFDKFRGCNQIAWLHDACYKHHNDISDWNQFTEPNKVKIVSVSKWHSKNLKSLCPSLDITSIYSPVDETCYSQARATSIDRHQLVWLSSPHKGLDKAILVFNKLRDKDPRFKLAVFNPGYLPGYANATNVVQLGSKPRPVLREVVSSSLCLFYPTEFEETFGLVASESNALGTPMAGYKIAALAESSSGPFAENEEQLIDQVLTWSTGSRPKITGNEEFRFHNIYPQWLKLFNRD